MPMKAPLKNILIIEDEIHLCHLMQRILQRHGYSILAAFNGKEGLAHFEKNQDSLDLVILDMHLPDFSCQEIVEKIIASKKTMKILLTSGMLDSTELDCLPKTENIMVLMKPYDNQTLIEKIENFSKTNIAIILQ